MASPPLRAEASQQGAGNRSPESMAISVGTAQRLRNETGINFPGSPNQPGASTNEYCVESWVEISSQPSSSSLSSIGDEIIVTGLRVQDPRRRSAKRPRNQPSHLSQQTRQFSNSSQEEYDESESDEDHVLTSSNEHLSSRPGGRPAQLSAQQQTYHTSDDDDEDENGTALGVGRARTRSSNATADRTFTPQPNAFSHPPSITSQRTNPASLQPDSGSYFPRTPASQNHNHRHSYSGRSANTTNRQQQHTPFSGTPFSPSSQDHDAALRASLTTLLSCAAAARGLPKRNHNSPNANSPWGAPQPNQPMNQEPSGNIGGLRLVPESALMDEDNSPPPRSRISGPNTSAAGRGSPIRIDSNDLEKGKRKSPATNANPSSSAKEKERVIKKKRTGSNEDMGYFMSLTTGLGYVGVTPTFLTWIVSAGVVVLVGVVGFGAGYAMGREAGLQEGTWVGAGGTGAGTGGSGSCAKEVVRGGGGGLRKIRMAITA